MTERELNRALWMARALRAESEVEHWIRSERDFSGYRMTIKHVIKYGEPRTPNDWIWVWKRIAKVCREKAMEFEI